MYRSVLMYRPVLPQLLAQFVGEGSGLPGRHVQEQTVGSQIVAIPVVNRGARLTR
jgi:hypothetical protein